MNPTPKQAELAAWLATSEPWKTWCAAHPDEQVPAVTSDDGEPIGPDPFARFWLRLPGVYLPRLDTSRLVGPLMEMLRQRVFTLWMRDDGVWVATTAWPSYGEYTSRGPGGANDWPEGRHATDAEALCALLREVSP